MCRTHVKLQFDKSGINSITQTTVVTTVNVTETILTNTKSVTNYQGGLGRGKSFHFGENKINIIAKFTTLFIII